MKKLYLILLIPFISFAQENEISFSKIDSICMKTRKYAISEGKIVIKENNENIGEGGYSITLYLNLINNNKHSNLESKSELIKAIYSEGKVFNNNITEKIESSFYYNYKAKLFFVKLKLFKSENEQTKIQYFDLTKEEIDESQSISNILNLDLKNWLKGKNIEILEFYNKK